MRNGVPLLRGPQ
jgi:SnoaL-like domain